MADNNNNQSSNSSKETSPLKNNTFDLSPSDSRSSNLRFGAIGGPTTPLPPPQPPQRAAPLTFQHVTDISSLSLNTNTVNERTLTTNRPGQSYVTSLPTWRRVSGPEAPAPAPRNPTRDEVAYRPRPEIRPAPRGPSYGGDYVAQQAEALRKYQSQPHLRQQLVQPPSQAIDRPRMGGGHTRPFRPMNSKLYPEEVYKPLSQEDKAFRDAHGISHNYLGEATNPANISADIREADNCSVWITGLPPNCNYYDLLSAIAVHQPGKVWSSHISPPDQNGPRHLLSHSTSAAKVIFYLPHEAQRLLRVATDNRLVVNGYKTRARSNRILSRPQEYEDRTSRCLMIRGNADVVNYDTLRRLFNVNFDFDTQEVLVRDESADGLWRTIEWRFGSWRAQAGAAFMAIRAAHPQVKVTYAIDPCDQPAGGF